jgi:hypothetical protein
MIFENESEAVSKTWTKKISDNKAVAPKGPLVTTPVVADAPTPAAPTAPTIEEVRRALDAAAKQLGRAKIVPLMAGLKLAELGPDELRTLNQQLESLMRGR